MSLFNFFSLFSKANSNDDDLLPGSPTHHTHNSDSDLYNLITDDDVSNSIHTESSPSYDAINPANSLPCDSETGIDIMGNPYGTDCSGIDDSLSSDFDSGFDDF